MANTTNFGWETPDDTDLVKDGAAAMRTLGNAIDTSLVDLKGGTTGQVLSKTSNTDMDFTWVTSDDANAIQNAIVDAKGDLISATAADTPARLAVGNNGEILVADSSATTGLRWQGNYPAGKNKIINGDFNIWQRGTSFTSVANGTYTSDRWIVEAAGGSGNVTQQSFTAGSELGNNQYFLRFTKSTTGDRGIAQRIEDVRTLAGQTITVSFWMKGSVSGSLDSVLIIQRFGSGGSSEVVTNALSSQAFTTSWVRYSATVTLPSISGKTIEAGNNLTIRIDPADAFTGDFDIWGVQVEQGSVATAFQTATGTLAGELAACQRYYFRNSPNSLYGYHANGSAVSSTKALMTFFPPVTMRVSPTSVDFSNVGLADGVVGIFAITGVVVEYAGTGPIGIGITGASGLTTNRPYIFCNSNNTSGYFGLSAEL
jgi:hypothetical protein